jgi:hypothetical protein
MLQSSGFGKRILVTVFMSGSVVGVTFFPYLRDANYIYTVPNITDFRIVDRAVAELKSAGVEHPSADEVARRVALSEWEQTRRKGELDAQREVERVSELLPYTVGDNYLALLSKPLYESHASVAFVCLMMLGTSLFLKYLFDPPSWPHFEKIHYALFLYCALEGIHALALSKATALEELSDLDRIGRYATSAVMVVFIALFISRLRFLTSDEGSFYERKLEHDPASISRWRDGIDRFILRTFLSHHDLARRFLVRRSAPKRDARGANIIQ